MKGFIKTIIVGLLGAGLMTGVVAAAPPDNLITKTATCSIYNTGSDSYNSCVLKSDRSAQVTCDNNIYVLNNNSQNAGTGGVTVSDNGNGGSAVSGSATNQSGVTVTIGASCGTVAQTTTATPSPTPSSPVAPPAATPTPQVVVPLGAVEAGAGGGSRPSALSVAALSASAVTVGLGSVLLRRQLLGRR